MTYTIVDYGISCLALFTSLVLYCIFIKPVSKVLDSRRIKLQFVLGLALWAVFLGGISQSGFLSNFNALPPRMLIVFAIPLLVISWSISKGKKALNKAFEIIPPANLILLQSFRVIVEYLLWVAFLEGRTPVQMTFEGYNWDIISGLLPLGIFYFFVCSRKYRFVVGVVYNVVGLLLLINILSIAIMSIPGPLRQFMNEPPNDAVANFPLVYLPGILVPIAYTLHWISLKQLFYLKRSNLLS